MRLGSWASVEEEKVIDNDMSLAGVAILRKTPYSYNDLGSQVSGDLFLIFYLVISIQLHTHATPVFAYWGSFFLIKC